MKANGTATNWEDRIILETRKDLKKVVEILRRAIKREEELGPGLSTRLDVLKDEVLSLI
jgi:hypothetical protein